MWAVAGMIGTVAFLALVLVLHALEPGYSIVRDAVSAYANGAYGALLDIGFVCRGLAACCLVIGLWRALPRSGRLLQGLAALGAYGLSSVLAGFFPMDPVGSSPTLVGTIHIRVGLVAFASIALAALALTRSFSKAAGWRTVASVSKALSLLLLIALLGVVVVYLTPHSGVFGIIERAASLTEVVWLLVVAAQLYRNDHWLAESLL